MQQDQFGTTAVPLRKRAARNETVISLTIISHPQMMRMGQIFQLHGNRFGLSRLAPDFSSPGHHLGQPLDDPYLSRSPIQFSVTASGGMTIQGNGKTSVLVNNQALSDTMTLSKDDVNNGIVLAIEDRIVLLLHRCLLSPPKAKSDYGLIGHSDLMHQLRIEIDRVADLQVPVLLRGESGAGKELVANGIHHASKVSGPFISVNMGAIPPTLAASELFGATKGAFTGAVQSQLGFFRSAQHGTLFLDEIGETPAEIQVLLLRALETGEISPVGAQKAMPYNTRFLAATDADLESKIKEDSFKSPLFHRLSGYEIQLPSLKERREDLGRLFLHFAKKVLAEIGESKRLMPNDPYANAWLPASLMCQLLNFNWPGNVRQLSNVVRQMIIGCRGEDELTMVPNVAKILQVAQQPEVQVQKSEPKSVQKPADLSNEEIIAAMDHAKWDIKAAAKALGISRGALYLLIDKVPGLQKASDLSAATIELAVKDCGGDLDSAAAHLKVSARALRRRINDLGLG